MSNRKKPTTKSIEYGVAGQTPLIPGMNTGSWGNESPRPTPVRPKVSGGSRLLGVGMRIKDIEIFWLDVPFHPIPQRNMQRQQHGWRICEMCRVTGENGMVGMGETLPNYTWGKVSQAAIERAKGGNVFELMWDDSLGAGLQMALFDLAGKAAGVPVHRLLGQKHRDHCPISWWGIDMSPEDYASETRDAVKNGYTSFKQKARPWWDVFEQIRLSAAEVDDNFKFDYDFNEHLVNASHALPVLRELDTWKNVAIFEEPIPRGDIEGNKRIRAQLRSSIALHYVGRDVVCNLHHDMCDGYVVGGGASTVTRAGHLCQEANKMFWLQLVGTAWTTTMAMHLGAVLQNAQWPAVTCMNMYVDQLVKNPLKVEGGFIAVPDKPGLGIEFDERAMKYQVKGPEKAQADAIYAIVRPSGQKIWYPGEYGPYGFWTQCWAGNVPICERGVRLDTWANDESKEWKAMKERILSNGPVWESPTHGPSRAIKPRKKR